MSKILVVEDSPIQRELMATLLRKNHFEIATASNGLEAIAQVRSRHPDIVVLDIVMPKMNGYELCRKLRENPKTWNTNIIICSAKSTTADRYWGMRNGANAYISKPFPPQELVDTINELLNA
jgi:twitching motility two-component system response regulator PilH